MSFNDLKLHPSLLKGIKELGFARPTPIQADAIPPALEGRDVLACAHDGQRQDGRVPAADPAPADRQAARHDARARADADARARGADPRRPQRARRAHADHRRGGLRRRRHGAAGARVPQRRRRDHRDARPAARSLHARRTRSSTGLEYLVLDEADRMLDMGFLPDIRRVLGICRRKRQTLFFSATMPPPIAALTREMLHNPVTINLERQSAPASASRRRSIRCRRSSSRRCCSRCSSAATCSEALVFTRTKHRANRLARLSRQAAGINAERIHGNRSQAQRTDALEGFKSGRYPRARRDRHRGARHRRRGARPRRELRRAAACPRTTSTASAARGAPKPPATPSPSSRPRKKATCAPSSARSAQRLPRVTVPDFDYNAKAAGEAGDSARGTDRRNPRPQAGRTCPRRRQCGAPFLASARPGAARRRAATARSPASRRAARPPWPSLAFRRSPPRPRRIGRTLPR